MSRTTVLSGADKPPQTPIEPTNIPVALRMDPRWVRWSYVRKCDKWTKVPVGKSNDPTTWGDFATIFAAYSAGQCDGVGFMLGEGWAGIDLDDCRTDGELSPLAHDVIAALDTYCEVSPTGTGVKLICRGALPPGRTKNKQGTLELYSSGRYFCVTGQRVSGDIGDRQEHLEALYTRYLSDSSTPALEAMLRIEPKDTEQDGSKRLFAYACRAVEHNLTDDVALATIREAAETYPFPRQWSDSEIIKRLRDAESMTVRGSARPAIKLGFDFPRVVADVNDALAKSDVYQHLGRLTTVDRQPEPCKYQTHDNGAPRLAFVPPSCIIEKLTAAADFFKEDGKQCLPPKDLRSAIFSRGNYPGVRVIHGVVSRPILLPDGEIVSTPGYHTDTGQYLDITGHWPQPMSTDESVALLLDVWREFPFASKSSEAACLAALLTLLVRRIIAGNTPMFVVDGNRSRVGKGLQTDSWTMISEGRRASRYTDSTQDELRKFLTSVAVAGIPYVLFDNLQGRFGGPVIEAALTTGTISSRLLGGNEVVDVPLHIAWFGTGNGYTCSRDMVGRTCPILLDTDSPNPETRKFERSDLLGYVEQNRQRLLIAGLSIVSNFIRAGQPLQDLPNFGGFDAWSGLIRGAIVWAGLDDPLGDREQLTATADEGADIITRQLLAAWKFAGPVNVKAAIEAAATGNEHVALQSILDCRDERFSAAEFLGKLLRSARGQVVDGKSFTRTDHKVPKWFIQGV